MGKNPLLPLVGLVGLMASLSAAAPVPMDKDAKQKELESLWADLYKDEPTASAAVIKLFKQPDHAVPFLKAKLPPLKLEEDKCKSLLKTSAATTRKSGRPRGTNSITWTRDWRLTCQR